MEILAAGNTGSCGFLWGMEDGRERTPLKKEHSFFGFPEHAPAVLTLSSASWAAAVARPGARSQEARAEVWLAVVGLVLLAGGGHC